MLYEGGEVDTSKPQIAVYIVDDSEKIRLLADFTQLSGLPGITKAAIGYHLHLLMDAGLIHIDKVEAEEHGILQKYYTPIAFLLIINPNRIPRDVQRYFIRTQIDHLRGIISVFKLNHHVSEVSSEDFEELAVAMLRQLKIVGQKHTEDVAPKGAESLRVKIYAEASPTLRRKRNGVAYFIDIASAHQIPTVRVG